MSPDDQQIVKSEGHLLLKIVRDNFFFNNNRIQVKADKYSILKASGGDAETDGLGDWRSQEIEAEKLKDFVYLLSGLELNNESNYLYVNKQLEYRALKAIEVGKLEFFKDEEIYSDSEDKREHSKEVYFKSINLW